MESSPAVTSEAKFTGGLRHGCLTKEKCDGEIYGFDLSCPQTQKRTLR